MCLQLHKRNPRRNLNSQVLHRNSSSQDCHGNYHREREEVTLAVDYYVSRSLNHYKKFKVSFSNSAKFKSSLSLSWFKILFLSSVKALQTFPEFEWRHAKGGKECANGTDTKNQAELLVPTTMTLWLNPGQSIIRPDCCKGLWGWTPAATITKTSSGERCIITDRRDCEIVIGKGKCRNSIYLPINW